MQKRYNLLIQRDKAIEKLDSIPERSRGAYVTSLIENDVDEVFTREQEERIKEIVVEILQRYNNI